MSGFSKSLISQLLPWVRKEMRNFTERSTGVIFTPLVSIMKDQVEELSNLELETKKSSLQILHQPAIVPLRIVWSLYALNIEENLLTAPKIRYNG